MGAISGKPLAFADLIDQYQTAQKVRSDLGFMSFGGLIKLHGKNSFCDSVGRVFNLGRGSVVYVFGAGRVNALDV